jgi:hypothetical protein
LFSPSLIGAGSATAGVWSFSTYADPFGDSADQVSEDPRPMRFRVAFGFSRVDLQFHVPEEREKSRNNRFRHKTSDFPAMTSFGVRPIDRHNNEISQRLASCVFPNTPLAV